jgi:hypothetical protein
MSVRHGATAAGFAAAYAGVAASYGISYGFERRPLKLWLINGGYHTLQFTALRSDPRPDAVTLEQPVGKR